MSLFTLKVYSHNFAITGFSRDTRNMLSAFAKEFAEYEVVKNWSGGVSVDFKRIYAAVLSDKTEYRFHRNALDNFLEYLNTYGFGNIVYTRIDYEYIEPEKVSIPLLATATPKPEQRPLIEHLTKPYPSKLVVLEPGGGKAQPLDALIKVPNGWSRMGNMRVGDIVTTPDGGTAPITGVYPQGVLDIYCLTFTGKRQAECCLEHLWAVYIDGGNSRIVLDTLGLMQALHHNYRVEIDVPFAAESNIKRIALSDIEWVGRKEAQCISVDHPDHLYITNDFIVTHNTFSSLYAISLLGERFVINIRPMYIKRWLDALFSERERMLDLRKEDVMVIKGTKQLQALIAMAAAGELTAKLIIISNKTLYFMYAHYSRTGGDTSFYGCHPNDFYPLLKANRMIDEVHQDFHFNFIQDMYTHTKTTFNLSGTMTSDLPFINKMYGWMFPPLWRIKGTGYVKYIAVKALAYTLNDRDKVRFLSRGRSSYSHIEFEKSVLKYKDMTSNYLNMVDVALKEFYFHELEAGQKALIFAASIEMCSRIVEYLQTKYPDLVINKYTSGDPYENLIISDISVSTIGSAGTAVDIPDLKYQLATTAVSKTETNIQMAGRLRRSKRWPEMTPVFSYLVCMDIDKHISYHNKKIKLLSPIVMSHQLLYLDLKL